MEITVQQPHFLCEDRIILDLYLDKRKLFSEEGFSSRIANTIGARRESPIFLRHGQEETREKQNSSEKNQKNLIAYCAGL